MTAWTNSLLSEEQWTRLREADGEVVWREAVAPVGSVLAAGERDPSLMGASIAWGQPDPLDLIENEALQWVQISTAGYTRYDTVEFRQAMQDRAVLVTNSSGVYDRPCGEHVLAFLLSETRNLTRSLGAVPEVGSTDWNRLRAGCRLLQERSILILGYGAIGEEIAGLLEPFGCRCRGVRRRPRGDERVEVFPLEELDRLLPDFDVVINILPDHPETRNFMDDGFFAKASDGCVIMNIGRGNTVDREALFRALKSGKVGSAWLDVTDPEPLPLDHPLQRHPNCHITPHIAGGHLGESDTGINHFLENLKRFREGQPLKNRIFGAEF